MARRQPDTVANPARGVVLVVAAVLVGLFLLRNGLDSSVERTATGAGQGTDQATDSTDDGSTTTTLATRPAAEVKVIVLNDSGAQGAAAGCSAVVKAAGYLLEKEDGDNASLPGNADTTRVLYTEGFQAEAVAVAATVKALAPPEALGTQSPGPVGAANVVVVLGIDRATPTPCS